MSSSVPPSNSVRPPAPARRSVLQAAGALAALVPSCTASSVAPLGAGVALPPVRREGRGIQHLENQHLQVTLFDDASAVIVVKASAQRWRMRRVALQDERPFEEGLVWPLSRRSSAQTYAARFVARQEGPHVRYVMFGRDGRPQATFVAHVTLEGAALCFDLRELPRELENLTFPPPLECDSLLFPQGVGAWVREPLTEPRFWRALGHLNMRFFAGLRGGHGWLAIFARGAENAGVMATEMSASPGWMQSLSTWRGPHTVRYEFVQGDHVAVARAFRVWAQGQGLHGSLREKLQHTPALQSLARGRLLTFVEAYTTDPLVDEERLRFGTGPGVSREPQLHVRLTHGDVARLLAEAKQMGVSQGMAMLQGWAPGGYDWRHPDVWPPEPALGSLSEMKALLTSSPPFTLGVHDNYQDIYRQSPSWPKGVNRRADGSRMPGGPWRGGQAFILNSRASLRYAERNWRELRTLGPRMMYIDTVTAASLYESHDPLETQTRADDLAGKRDLLRFFKEQGLVVGSEEGADFGVPLTDWVWCRHTRSARVSVPLWPLVYHDAVLSSRIQPHFDAVLSGDVRSAPRGPAPRWLPDLLWAYPMCESPEGEGKAARWAPTFAASLPVDAWLERTGTADLYAHRYVTEDGEVEQTEFSSGQALLANFGDQPTSFEGQTVPAGGFVMRA